MLQEQQTQITHKKLSTSLTKPSDARTTPEEEVEAVEGEEEVVAAVVAAVEEVVQDLLPNLSPPARAKLLSQLQQTLEPWAKNQQSSLAIVPKQTTSSRKLKHTSVSIKTSPDLILQSKGRIYPHPYQRR